MIIIIMIIIIIIIMIIMIKTVFFVPRCTKIRGVGFEQAFTLLLCHARLNVTHNIYMCLQR